MGLNVYIFFQVYCLLTALFNVYRIHLFKYIHSRVIQQQEKFRVQCLAQGHFERLNAGVESHAAHPPIKRWPILPTEALNLSFVLTGNHLKSYDCQKDLPVAVSPKRELCRFYHQFLINCTQNCGSFSPFSVPLQKQKTDAAVKTFNCSHKLPTDRIRHYTQNRWPVTNPTKNPRKKQNILIP